MVSRCKSTLEGAASPGGGREPESTWEGAATTGKQVALVCLFLGVVNFAWGGCDDGNGI
jgi:hypothetical protein